MTRIFKKNDFTVADWLSPIEKKKLQKALEKRKGFVNLVITHVKDYDRYYIDGKQIFSRKIIKNKIIKVRRRKK